MPRLRVLGGVLVVLLSVDAVAAQSALRLAEPPRGLVRLAPLGPALESADPGRVVTVAFSVVNLGGDSLTVPLDWQVPAGWQRVVGAEGVHLDAFESGMVILSVRVPPTASAGRHEVMLQTPGAASAIQAVTVRRRVALHLRALEAPARLLGRESARVRWRLTNVGNDTVRVALALRLSGVRIGGLPAGLDLLPGESRDLGGLVEADDEVQVARDGRIWLQASLADGGDAVVRDRTRILLVPSGRALREAVPAATSVARVMALGSALGAGPQASVDLRVPLRTDGTAHAAFSGTTASPVASRYGDRGVATLSLTAPGVHARAGSGVFVLSPLAGAFQAGVGAEAGVERGGVTVTGLARQRPGGVPEVGGRAAWQRSGVELAGNVYRRSGPSPGTAATVQVSARSAQAWIDAEAGLGGVRLDRWAHRLHGAGTWRGVRASGGVDWIAPGHLAAPSGDRQAGASVDVRLPRDTRLHLHVGDRQQGSPVGTDAAGWGRRRAEATVTRRYRGSWGSASSRAGVVRRTGWRIDGGTAETTGRLGATVRKGHVLGTIDTEAGQRQWPTGAVSTVLHGDASVSWQRRGVYLLTGVQGTRGREGALGAQQAWGARVQADLRSARSSLRATARWVDLAGAVAAPFLADRGRVDLRLTGRAHLRDGLVLFGDASAVWTDGTRRPAEFRVGLEWSASGRGPIRLRPDVVSGRVFDASAGAGVDGVFVRLGEDVAVTGPDGRFEFARPDPGVYVLQVDPLHLGQGIVPLRRLPLDVEVPSAGFVPEIEIPVARRAEVSGVVEVYEIHGGVGTVAADTVSLGGLRNARVVARRGEDARVAVTDAQGRYQFRDLAAGAWRLTIDGHEATTVEVQLPPGGRATVPLRVVRPQPRVRMIRAPRDLVQATPSE